MKPSDKGVVVTCRVWSPGLRRRATFPSRYPIATAWLRLSGETLRATGGEGDAP